MLAEYPSCIQLFWFQPDGGTGRGSRRSGRGRRDRRDGGGVVTEVPSWTKIVDTLRRTLGVKAKANPARASRGTGTSSGGGGGWSRGNGDGRMADSSARRPAEAGPGRAAPTRASRTRLGIDIGGVIVAKCVRARRVAASALCMWPRVAVTMDPVPACAPRVCAGAKAGRTHPSSQAASFARPLWTVSLTPSGTVYVHGPTGATAGWLWPSVAYGHPTLNTSGLLPAGGAAWP